MRQCVRCTAHRCRRLKASIKEEDRLCVEKVFWVAVWWRCCRRGSNMGHIRTLWSKVYCGNRLWWNVCRLRQLVLGESYRGVVALQDWQIKSDLTLLGRKGGEDQNEGGGRDWGQSEELNKALFLFSDIKRWCCLTALVCENKQTFVLSISITRCY